MWLPVVFFLPGSCLACLIFTFLINSCFVRRSTLLLFIYGFVVVALILKGEPTPFLGFLHISWRNASEHL